MNKFRQILEGNAREKAYVIPIQCIGSKASGHKKKYRILHPVDERLMKGFA